jgi:hypothetical protein
MEDVGRRSRLFSLDSLRGYNETHATRATDESLEDESSDVSFEDLSLRMREVGVQVDLGLTYPDLVSQVMRQYHLAAVLSTNTIGGLTYANFSGVEAVESIGLPPNDRERAVEEEEEENTMSCDSRRVSNTTVYEDIEDVVAYFDDDAAEQDETDGRPGPPPLPPRRPEALTTVGTPTPPPVQRFMRKNLSAHLGLGQIENGCGGDITEAQRIDLENLRQRSESRKDLSRFLGLSEGVAAVSSSSPVPPLAAVVKRPCRRLLAKNGANNSRNSFIENILLGKVLKRADNRTQSGGGEETSAYQQLLNSPGSDCNSNTPAATAAPTVKGSGGGESNLNLRQRKLEHFFGAALDPAVTLRLDNRNEEEEQSSKSRSSSFSSTVSSSSSSSSAASEPCSFSSSLSMGSASSSSCSVVRLFQPARFHSSLSSLRRSKSTVRRCSSVLPVIDNIRPEVGNTSREDISEFIERGMPVIPFSSSPSTRSPAKNRNVVPVTVDSTAERPLDRIGHSLDALIDFARHELRRSRERPVGAGSKGTVEAGAESLYMEMRAQPLPARQHAEDGGDTCDQLIPHQSQEQLIHHQSREQLIHEQSEEQLVPPQRPEQLTGQIEEQLIPCDQEQLIAPSQEEEGEQMRRQERNQLISEVNQLDYMDMGLVRRVLALRDQ